MSTHNIGFYEEISKMIPKLLSNIIKYTPYNVLQLMFDCHVSQQMVRRVCMML